jgi:hypothetical protein
MNVATAMDTAKRTNNIPIKTGEKRNFTYFIMIRMFIDIVFDLPK